MEFYDEHGVHPLPLKNKWCVHAYYTMCPYAPDGSGRILFSGADIKTGKTKIYIMSSTGELLDEFGDGLAESNFYHTGHWQTWSDDAQYVYYQGGDMINPVIHCYNIKTGEDISMCGDMEGAPPFGNPIISGYLGMLYAAGYADGHYYAHKAPIPFEQRDKHGLFKFNVKENKCELALSVNDILKIHPCREMLMNAEKKYIEETGNTEGFTLMEYCVRWNAKGDRFLFYFGNHCVDKSRKEPKLTYVFTSDKDMKNIYMALDMSFDKFGLHWGWHPDGEHLIGYFSDPDEPQKLCLCSVKYDGTELKRISKHSSGGHASICPANYNILVTDEFVADTISTEMYDEKLYKNNAILPGRVVFIDLTTDTEICSYVLPRVNGTVEPAGRNPLRVCHHPVWSSDGKKVLVNTLPGENSVLCQLDFSLIK